MIRRDMLRHAARECLKLMYKNSQPSVDFTQEKCEDNFYMHHYLSEEEYKFILEYFKDIYAIKNNFKIHCDIIYNYLKDGGLTNTYAKSEYGIKEYEKTPPLKDFLSNSDTDKVLRLIETCKNFYRFDIDEYNFNMLVMNYGPTSNKESVIEYWKNKGIDLNIEEHNSEYFYEKYYLDISDEELYEE